MSVACKLEGSEVTAQLAGVTREQRRRVWVEAASSGSAQITSALRAFLFRLKVNVGGERNENQANFSGLS